MKHNNSAAIFNAVFVCFALVFFLVFNRGIPKWNGGVFVYSFWFALAYLVTVYACYEALRIGPFAIGSLVSSYALTIPTVYGLLFLKEPFTVFVALGLLLFLVSLYLVYEKTHDDRKVTIKWIIYLALTFFPGGICSVVQKEQQIAFNGEYKCEFMIFSFMIVAVVFVAIMLLQNRKMFCKEIKSALFPAALCGLANGATQYLVMTVTAFVATSVFFPVISAGSMIVAFFCSVVIYREKFTRKQIIGIILGLASLVFLNL